MSALRNGDALVGLFQDFSRNQLQPQANALRVFVSCQGNTQILKLQNAPLQEKQVQLHRLVQEMSTQHNMREEAAVEVCSAFWRAAIGTEYPVSSVRQEKRSEKPEQERRSPVKRIPEVEKKPVQEERKPVPDPPTPKPKPKPRSSGVKKVVLVGLAVLLVLVVLSFVTGGDPGKRSRADLKPYGLEDSIVDMLLAGTEEIYTYPDGTWMEFYYDEAGQEIYRVYVNTENDIENLFEARYDDAGRLVYHQSFDGEGNLLRCDSYDFHSSEDTAQRRITLGDGRSFQGQSTFDENGYETFTLKHQDGTSTVYVYKDGGVLTNLTKYDAAGEITDEPIAYEWWENQPKVYNSRQTVIGWVGSNGYVRPYVQGICGGKLKEYSVEDDHAFIETYDTVGNLLEKLYYRDGQLNELGSHEVHTYDALGNYTGYTETYYTSVGDGNYTVTVYDKNGIRLSMESHFFEGEEESVSCYRYETELDDQGREICVREYDGETGRLISIDETEYDRESNAAKETRTYYHEDGTYHVSVRDAEGHITSDITYYPSGSVQTENAYNREGQHIKTTRYYESGQVQTITEYSGTGETLSRKRYYENGKPQYLDEYDAQGNLTRSTSYYENGKVDNLTEYNSQGDIRKMVSYYENGQIRYLTEYNDQGETVKQVYYNEDGTVVD